MSGANVTRLGIRLAEMGSGCDGNGSLLNTSAYSPAAAEDRRDLRPPLTAAMPGLTSCTDAPHRLRIRAGSG